MGRRGHKAAGPDQTVRAGGFAVSARREAGRIRAMGHREHRTAAPLLQGFKLVHPPWGTFGKNFISCLPLGGRQDEKSAAFFFLEGRHHP